MRKRKEDERRRSDKWKEHRRHRTRYLCMSDCMQRYLLACVGAATTWSSLCLIVSRSLMLMLMPNSEYRSASLECNTDVKIRHGRGVAGLCESPHC